MPEAKTLAVGVAILTILGMTVALAVPLGPTFTGDDDPENSGVTSAQEEPVNNTDNSSNDNSTDTDNDGDDDDPEDNDENGGADTPPCESNDDSSDSSDSSDCGSDGDGADDQHGEKDKNDDSGDDDSNGDNGDGADDKDGEKDKDGGNGDDKDGGNGDDKDGDDKDGDDKDGDNGDNGDNETDVTGTCEEEGLLLNNTLANELFDTENESGPLSEVIHENEHYLMEGGVILHESGCIVATIDNAAGDGGDEDPTEQLPGVGDGNETDDGTDDNETDDGTDDNETDGEPGTCEEGGLVLNNTLANELLGTLNEEGPISGALHENEELFQDGQVVIHEGSCIVATVDNNAPSGGGDIPEAP